MNSHDLTVLGYVVLLTTGVLLEVLATRTRARIPSLEHVLARVMRTRTGRVGVLVAWAWVGLHFFAGSASAMNRHTDTVLKATASEPAASGEP